MNRDFPPAGTGIDRDHARADTSRDREVQAAGRRNPEDPTENAPRRRANERNSIIFSFHVFDIGREPIIN